MDGGFKCTLIFLNNILVEKGDKKEANVEKYGKPIENVFISPVPLDSPIPASALMRSCSSHAPSVFP